MLELVNVPDNARKTGFVDTAMTRGTFVVQSGTFTAADITALPANQKDLAGFAVAGDLKLVKAYVGETGRCYPMNKALIVPEGSDDANDDVLAGTSVVFFLEGQFRTTEYTDVTSTVDFGDYLKLSTSGTLTDEATLHTETSLSVARLVSLDDSQAAPVRKRLQFELLR